MKKGFTLIELLAVIVILAIIALIATPIILNIISDTKEESNKRSVEMYGSAIKNAIAKYQLNNNESISGTFTASNDGKTLTKGQETLTIEYNGNVECTTTEIYEDGNIYLADCTVNGSKVEGYTYGRQILCTANTTKAQAYVWQGNADPVVIDSYAEEEVGLIASESGAYTPGVAYTCELGDGEEEIFYVLEENGDNVTLLLGRNLGGPVAWCNDETLCKVDGEWTNSAGPLTAMAAINERTEGWTKLTEDQISMPTAGQIANAAGKTFNNDNIFGLPTWLNSYTKFTDGGYGGYWTSTTGASIDPRIAWEVYHGGSLNVNYVDDGGYYGVRPVITIPKTQLG